MELLDFPDKKTWENRNKWIEAEIEQSMTGYSYCVSDHAIALFFELQACFCIGAWLSVIILSVSVIDAHLRETEASDDKIGTAKLFDLYYEGNEDINWLRKLRNKYVHIDLDNPVLDMNIQFDKRKELEADATVAIKMVINAFFQSSGT